MPSRSDVGARLVGGDAAEVGRRLSEELQDANALTSFEMDLVGMVDAGQERALFVASHLPLLLALRARLRQLGWPTWNLPALHGDLLQLFEACDALAPRDPVVAHARELARENPDSDEEVRSLAIRCYRFARECGVGSWEDHFDATGGFTYFDEFALANALLTAETGEAKAPVRARPRSAPLDLAALRRLWGQAHSEFRTGPTGPGNGAKRARSAAEPGAIHLGRLP